MTVKKGTSLEQIPVILFILSASRIKPGNDSSVASGLGAGPFRVYGLGRGFGRPDLRA